jgi:membrane protease YdiL (CAAX protease family)
VVVDAMLEQAARARRSRGGRGVYLFFALACAITWLLDLKVVLALLARETPSPLAMALGGLGAFGPTLAALAIALPRRELREVFGRWRTSLGLVVFALLLVPAQHLAATLIEVALGGQPAQWFYPPVRPEHFAALVVFAVGEEFGWRGFAYPRMAERHGPVLGSLILGMVWGVWHFGMFFTPDGPPSAGLMAVRALEFALAAVVFSAVFERSGRSMAVAFALHAGAHLDNLHRAPAGEVRLWVLRLLVLAVTAAIAARVLRRHAGAR